MASHVTIAPYFTVPEGKLDEFKSGFADFYERTRNGTMKNGQCFYYGFAINGNVVHCREGYKDAESALAHLAEVKEVLDKAVNLVGPENLKLDLIGPEKELDLLRETFEPLGTRFFHTDENSLSFFKHSGKEMKDTHVSIVPYHKVKPENMEMYQKIIEEFYENTKKGKAKCLFYEFARNGDTFFCREAYQNAEEILAHFNDVTETHQKSVGLAEVKVAIMGPKNELDKLRKIPEIKVDYFDLDDGSMITIE